MKLCADNEDTVTNEKDVTPGSHILASIHSEYPVSVELCGLSKTPLVDGHVQGAFWKCLDVINDAWMLELELKQSSNSRFEESGWSKETIQGVTIVV